MTNNNADNILRSMGFDIPEAEEIVKIKVDVHGLHQFDRDYEYPSLCNHPFTLSLFETLKVADVINFEIMARIYPEQAYIVAYKALPQYLPFFTTISLGDEVAWKSDFPS